MKKLKSIVLFMGMGAAITYLCMKSKSSCCTKVDDLMCKEKKKFKNIVKKMKDSFNL